MADEVGRLLIVSCSSFVTPKDIVKQILGKTEEDLPEPISKRHDGLVAFPWNLQTKYYTCDVCLYVSPVSKLPHQCGLASDISFHSVVMVFDQSEVSSFDEVKTWKDYIESQEPSVLLLLNSGQKVDNADKKGVSRREVLEWCLENSIEVVDLIPDEMEEVGQDSEELFGEQSGISRVVHALHCAGWPNMEMREQVCYNYKGSSGASTQDKENGVTGEAHEQAGIEQNGSSTLSHNGVLEDSNVVTASGPLEIDSLIPDSFASFDDQTENSDGHESFERLFSQLGTLKERASSMPHDERKVYAEKVAVAFWRAMGGDEDEIKGLSDEDD